MIPNQDIRAASNIATAAARSRPSIRWASVVAQIRLVTMKPPERIVTVWTQRLGVGWKRLKLDRREDLIERNQGEVRQGRNAGQGHRWIMA